MNYMEKGRKKNRLMPALITLMLLLSMIILPQSVIAAAPEITNPNPAHEATGVPVSTSSLSVDITGTTFTWEIGTSPDVGSSFGDQDNSSFECAIAGLSGGTLYTWYVNATEAGETANKVYTFTTNVDPPVVTDIPDQTINQGESFTTITLDEYVTDEDNAASEMTWAYSGNTDLTVDITSRIATITIPSVLPNWVGSETITFTATDPGDLSDSDDATFTVIGITPGAHKWGDATTDLIYGTTYASGTIKIDTSLWTDAGGGTYPQCFLYYPEYNSSGSPLSATEFSWDGPYVTGDIDFEVYVTSNEVETDTLNTGGYSILFNRSGMWIFDSDADHTAYEGYIWVNTSTDYDISSIADFEYNSSGDITITVQEGENDVGCMIAVIAPDNSTAYHNWQGDGSVTLGIAGNFTMAGDYIVMAYRDFDKDPSIYLYGDENGNAYNSSYGSDYSGGFPDSVTDYAYTSVGPWDPPEKNATEGEFTVITGEPVTSIPEANRTMYWSFDGQVNISVKDYDGDNISYLDCTVWNNDGANVTANLTIDNDNVSKGWVHINNKDASAGMDGGWGRDATGFVYGENGTWYAYLYKDINGDGNEEWNTTLEWRVAAGPDAQWKWVDDDGSVDDVDLWGSQKSNNDGIIPYIPTAINVPLDVEFIIYDSAGNKFGDLASGTPTSPKECAENITISGNSLFTGKLSDLPGYGLGTTACGYSGGVWSIPIVPTMSLGGGEITIKVTAFNSSVSEKISIGGENYGKNGSIVSVTPNEFMIDQENKTLTITVKNSETGVENPYMDVYLYYLDDGTITAANTMKPITGHTVSRVEAVNGVYTISFNTTQQTANQTLAGFTNVKAPRNLTVYVNGPGNREGYALIQMKPVNDLETHISVETFMAGLDYDDVVISCDFAGNSTDTPSTKTADKDSFFMKIVDENGDDVTGTTSSNGVLHNFYNTVLTGAYSVEKDNVYGLDAGTYSIYAWNNTHDSEGHNATFEIKAVEVTCDKAPFIWSVDANISATFTITYNGNPVNGTLRIDNMSDEGTYNSTWTNCSFTGTSDVGGNTSLQISKTKIINGVVTVHDISADVLHPNVAKQNITFWFKPTESGSVFAKATAQMTVEVPSITPDPMYIPLGRTTKVYCTATGRGETLSDVFIRLHGQGFDQNSTTDVDGRVAFSITPASTGNISIDVGETGRTLPDTVVYVVAWIIDVDVVAEVDEGEQFTVTVTKEGTTDVVVDATVTIKGIGTATTDVNGEVTFTAPDVTSDRTYTIKVTAEGYAPDPDTNTITVINTPKLILVIPDEVQATTTFNVAVADDTGSAIVGVTITFNEKTYTTGVNGIAKLTAPKTKGDYPIEATFGNYMKYTGTVTVTPAPGIPGFELLSLIVAIGVAFILLRRRRR